MTPADRTALLARICEEAGLPEPRVLFNSFAELYARWSVPDFVLKLVQDRGRKVSVWTNERGQTILEGYSGVGWRDRLVADTVKAIKSATKED